MVCISVSLDFYGRTKTLCNFYVPGIILTVTMILSRHLSSETKLVVKRIGIFVFVMTREPFYDRDSKL